MLIPVAAVVFAFVISVLYDLRTYHKFDWSRLVNHSTKMAMYLAAIGMLEVVAKGDPALSKQVVKFALAFAGAEVIGTFGMITQALKGPGTAPDALSSTLAKLDPFAAALQAPTIQQQQPPQNKP